jgi:opacity protein-like surface antigen
MKKIITAVLFVSALALSAVAQDWYQERDNRYQGQEWRAHIFDNVRTDLEHVWSTYRASDRERVRLDKTKEELYKMQVDLDQGRFDNGLLNDTIDSLRKSSNDDRLSQRDREIMADDVIRLKDYQNNHNHWPH